MIDFETLYEAKEISSGLLGGKTNNFIPLSLYAFSNSEQSSLNL